VWRDKGEDKDANDRPTIERYFYDEQWGLGVRQVRTRHFAGEAMFEFMVATTNNLLNRNSLFSSSMKSGG
jgi:hypothetical protein